MSEEDPFDDIDNILEYISDNIIFENKKQLNLFSLELLTRLNNLYINNFENESTTSEEDEEFLESSYKKIKEETTKSQYLWASKYEPKIKVNIDDEGFHSLI